MTNLTLWGYGLQSPLKASLDFILVKDIKFESAWDCGTPNKISEIMSARKVDSYIILPCLYDDGM